MNACRTITLKRVSRFTRDFRSLRSVPKTLVGRVVSNPSSKPTVYGLRAYKRRLVVVARFVSITSKTAPYSTSCSDVVTMPQKPFRLLGFFFIRLPRFVRCRNRIKARPQGRATAYLYHFYFSASSSCLLQKKNYLLELFAANFHTGILSRRIYVRRKSSYDPTFIICRSPFLCARRAAEYILVQCSRSSFDYTKCPANVSTLFIR